MAAIGKILAVLTLAVSLALLTWSVSLYVERPGWFDPVPDGVDQGNSPVSFAILKAETETLGRGVAAANEAWGAQLKTLEEREKIRAERQKAYAQRLQWARTGNPKDLIDPANPKSGKGFYEPVIDPATRLHDLSLEGGLPKGKAVTATDGTPLRGADTLLATLDKDVDEITGHNAAIVTARKAYAKLSIDVVNMETRVVKMGEIRASVQAELFFLATFEVNVYETRETVIRREKQLRARLKELGVADP